MSTSDALERSVGHSVNHRALRTLNNSRVGQEKQSFVRECDTPSHETTIKHQPQALARVDNSRMGREKKLSVNDTLKTASATKPQL